MRLLWTRQEESVATASGLLEDFHGEVAPACLVLSGGGPGVSTVWFPAAAAVVRGGVGCGRECGGRRGSRARHWPVEGEIRRRAGRGDCHRGCWLGDSKKRQSQMKQPLREAPVRHYLISYATAAAI